MKGDGHIKNGVYKTYTTISKKLADDVMELGIKLGYGTIIGVVLGAIIIGIINNLLSIMQASTALMEMVTGIIIIVAVAIDYIRRRDIGATMLRRRGGT